MVRPRNGSLKREAEQLWNWTLLMAVWSALCAILLFGVTAYGQADWMPEAVGTLPPQLLRWLASGLVGLTVLSGILYGWAAARARGQERRLRDSLIREAYAGAMEEILARRGRGHMVAPSPVHRPSAQSTSHLYREEPELTPRDAEALAAQWMRTLGARDVEVTRFRGDGGVDVTSSKYIAQVKHFSSNVGVAPVRELSGVVRVDGRRGLFFTTFGYAKGAIEFANLSGIGLFQMDHRGGRLTAVNDIAKALQTHGLER